MPRKEKETLQSLLGELRDKLKSDIDKAGSTEGYIPPIMEFVESADYLGLPLLDTPVILSPVQRLTLKVFYLGSEGNTGPESQITDEELMFLQSIGLDKDENGNVIDKIKSGNVPERIEEGHIFRELVLVWGRRSGKDFVSSIIALYEAMRLLEAPGGDPYAKYGLQRGGNPITILTIATAAAQAEVAFQEIKAKLFQSRYFKNKFIPEGVTATSIFLQTPQDRKDNEERKLKKLPLIKGGIEILSGHSNSDSLLGKQVFVLILDEVASYRTTDGASGGRRIYEALLPALNTFGRTIKDANGNAVLDKDGKERKIFDSKVVSISSPRGKEGILYDLFVQSPTQPDRLSMRLATWVVQDKRYTRESLRTSFSQFSEDRFMMEFGAMFSSTGGTNFFDSDLAKACFINTNKFVENGRNGYMYFAHLDPASNSNNYTLAIVHKEMRKNERINRAEQVVVLDHLKIWTPTKESPIIIDDIDKYILMKNRHFHIGLVTYDAWNSLASIQKLKKAGIPCRMTPFNIAHKNLVYSQLELLVNEGRLVLPMDGYEAQHLQNEMINLQRKWTTGSRLFSVFANRDSDTPTDDACDAVAGAAYSAMSSMQSRLPRAQMVSMPTTQRGAMKSFLTAQGTPYSQRVLDHMRATQGGGGIGFTMPPRPGY